jgi:hypothetical protein
MIIACNTLQMVIIHTSSVSVVVIFAIVSVLYYTTRGSTKVMAPIFFSENIITIIMK